MGQGICKLIDVCQTYQSMIKPTRGTLYLLATGQLDVANLSKYERLDIHWFLRQALQFLELEQDTVRMDIEELRATLERESGT